MPYMYSGLGRRRPGKGKENLKKKQKQTEAEPSEKDKLNKLDTWFIPGAPY